MNIIKNTAYNLIGLGLPLIVAIFTIPPLIHELGDAQFGLLTLIWAVVSYFGLFDLGLGRALTQQLSIRLTENDNSIIGRLIFTSTLLLLILGLIAASLMYFFSEISVDLLKGVPDRSSAITSVCWMAIAMPFIVLTSAFKGVLEAKEEFKIVNLIRIPMGIYTFLAPFLVVSFLSNDLAFIAAVLSIGRIVACVVHAYFALKVVNLRFSYYRVDRSLIKPLCTSGGWMTLSNIISPFMGYVDRFMIGFFISASSVAFYTTPQEMITKLWIIPGALTAVLFPFFAKEIGKQESKSSDVFFSSVKFLYILLFPICLFISTFSFEILSFWVNKDFAENSYVFLRVFSLGILINCLAHIPFTYIQSVNKPKVTAFVHMLEFPIFICMIYFLIQSYGVLGASVAWLLRMLLDTYLMFYFSMKISGFNVNSYWGGGSFVLTMLTFSIFIFDSLSIRVGAYILSVFLIVFLYRKDILMSYREYLKPMFNKAES